MVLTSIGAEGIDAVPSKRIWIENEAQAFDNAIVQLIAEPSVAEEIRLNASQLVVSKYDSKVIMEKDAMQLKGLL